VGIQGVENVNPYWWFVFCWLNKPYWYCCCFPESETSSIYWAKPNRFHLKTETGSRLRNVVFSIQDRPIDNVQKCDSYTHFYLQQPTTVFNLLCHYENEDEKNPSKREVRAFPSCISASERNRPVAQIQGEKYWCDRQNNSCLLEDYHVKSNRPMVIGI
jgi:hypothetical protein